MDPRFDVFFLVSANARTIITPSHIQGTSRRSCARPPMPDYFLNQSVSLSLGGDVPAQADRCVPPAAQRRNNIRARFARVGSAVRVARVTAAVPRTSRTRQEMTLAACSPESIPQAERHDNNAVIGLQYCPFISDLGRCRGHGLSSDLATLARIAETVSARSIVCLLFGSDRLTPRQNSLCICEEASQMSLVCDANTGHGDIRNAR